MTIPDCLKPIYPFTPKAFTTPLGARMSYVDEGAGDEAVLMLHGNPTWSFYYRDLIQAVAPGMRCVVPDHIGMGLSEKPAAYPYTLATRIDDIAALVGTLGLRKVHLVVHDWGGAIGFGYAAHGVKAAQEGFRAGHSSAQLGRCCGGRCRVPGQESSHQGAVRDL
jgi:haloalkane dehalogenase